MSDSPSTPPSTRPGTSRLRRLAFAVLLGGGVWLIGQRLTPVLPREIDVRVRLSAFRYEATGRATDMTLAFERGNDAVRVVTERFGPEGPPAMWERAIDLPEGDYDAVVTVQVQGHAVRRASRVHVRAGETLDVQPPPNE